MKKFFLLICLQLAFLLVSGAGLDTLLSERTRTIINRIQKKYAPDKRTAIFELDKGADGSLVIETTEAEAIKEVKAIFAKENIGETPVLKLLPASELGGKIYGVANLSVCNHRSVPGHAAEMATQTLLGTPVEILKKIKGYYLVRTPDAYLSWTESAGIEPLNKTDFEKWQQSEKIVFTSPFGHAYQSASKKSIPVSDLVAGNILVLLERGKKFHKAAFPDGRVAYVLSNDAVLYQEWISRANPTAAQVIARAKTFTGVPYLWGGTSGKGMDCSGFTKTCFFLEGLILPRDASQQALVGEQVDIYENDTLSVSRCLKNLRPGDLLFFASGKNKSKNPAITHTAIYLGNGEFIQAAGMVRVNSILPQATNYDDFQSRTLVSARRMLSAVGTPGVIRIDRHRLYNYDQDNE